MRAWPKRTRTQAVSRTALELVGLAPVDEGYAAPLGRLNQLAHQFLWAKECVCGKNRSANAPAACFCGSIQRLRLESQGVHAYPACGTRAAQYDRAPALHLFLVPALFLHQFCTKINKSFFIILFLLIISFHFGFRLAPSKTAHANSVAETTAAVHGFGGSIRSLV